METKNKNSHFEGLKNPPKFENHEVKFQKDRDSLSVKLLEEQRELRKGSVRKRSEIEKSTNLCTLDEKKIDRGGETLLPQATLTVCGAGELYQRTPSSHVGGGEFHLKPPFHMGGELTRDEIQQPTYMFSNTFHLIMGLLCFSYYLAPHVFPLILLVLNITMFFYKNLTKIKKTYETIYQIWSEKSAVQKLSKKEKIRNDILYETGKDINPFNPEVPFSEQPIFRMSEKSNVPKSSENNPVIKKIENLTGPLNFEGIERNSDNLSQNLSRSCTAEPKMKNEKSYWTVTKKVQLRSAAPSSNAEDSYLKKWHTKFRDFLPWFDNFFLAF